ncbi:Histone acetyltransferase p300, partial [Galemys pyrenaicus]
IQTGAPVGLGNTTSLAVGQQSTPNLNTDSQIDPSVIKRASEALGLPYQVNQMPTQPQVQGENQQNQQSGQSPQGMRHLGNMSPMGVNGSVVQTSNLLSGSRLQPTRNTQKMSGNANMASLGPVPTAAQPSSRGIWKQWHGEITQDIRNHLVYIFLHAMFPTLDLASLRDRQMENLAAYARKLEGDTYESANSRAEYYHLIAMKIYKIQKELEERVARLQKQNMLPNFLGMVPMSVNPGPTMGQPQPQMASSKMSGNANMASLGPVPTAAQPSSRGIWKQWHGEITQDIRNHLVYIFLVAMFPTPDPAALRDRRMENLVAIARKMEGELYETANSQVSKIQKELAEKQRSRLQRQGMLPSSAGTLPMSMNPAPNMGQPQPRMAS